MYCSNCGIKLEEFSKFCHSCGKSVSGPIDKNILNAKNLSGLTNSSGDSSIENTNTNAKINLTQPDQINYSGFWRRFAAIYVDIIILSFIGLVFIPFIDINSLDINSLAISLIIGIPFAIGYQIYFLGKFNATPGKLLMGIRVMPINSSIQRLDIKSIILRYIGSFLSGLVFFIGYLIQPFNRRRRAMHDFIAGTVVIDLNKKRSPWIILIIILICLVAQSVINNILIPTLNPKLFLDLKLLSYKVMYEQDNDLDLNADKTDNKSSSGTLSSNSSVAVSVEPDSKKLDENQGREVSKNSKLEVSGDADISTLISKWLEINSKCRGGSGDDPNTWKACDARNALSAKLDELNFCYGKKDQAGYEMRWHRCEANSSR